MMPRHRATTALAPAVLVTLVGLVEVARDRDWDLITIFAAAVVAQLVALGVVWLGRQPVHVRADLTVWLHEHAAATGEPAGRIVDRALAEHRAGLVAGERESR
ncbi:hypothetical protein [Actinokineospora xionganensis]|uniref:Uncharacterized protein n=1 Tax=Actinokineospora xionganensis TaxID=2684470 RepID=A0ABR7KZN0_9PSEU|nr:hypothetical protein [Actinokineospora xionganensis]MBC6445891.1 hypothetical protein [Actinokineospora xionganensis]